MIYIHMVILSVYGWVLNLSDKLCTHQVSVTGLRGG